MPRCKVISHEGNGQYLVELQQDWSILDRKIADLTTIIDTLTPQISIAETVYNGLKAEFDALVDIQELALAELVDANNDPSRESERKALTDAVVLATNNAQKKRPEVQTAYQKWQILLVKKQQYENKKTVYQANPRTNAQVNAQAVDKIDGTAAVNIPTGGTYPVLAPNTFVDAYQLNREADTPLWYIPTALQHNESTIPGLLSEIVLPANINGKIIADDLIEDGAQFWNCAMLPGYQRWNSHIRRGVITAINDIIFTVRLTPILSGVDTPLIGQQDTFDFNVDYFCGVSAFQVTDEVIVRIDTWSDTAPVGYVIGFADGPARECQYSDLPTGTPIFTWPRLFYDLAHISGGPPEVGNWGEDWGEFVSDILTDVETWEGGPDETPEFTVPYVEAHYVAEADGWVALNWVKKNTQNSLVLVDPNDPGTDVFPGTGNIAYTDHSSSAGLTIDLSATIPRRCATIDLPAPQIYVGAAAPVEGSYIEEHSVKYGSTDGPWYRFPTNRDFSGPNGSEVPQPTREFRRKYAKWSYGVHYQGITGDVPLGNYYLPNGTGRTVLNDLVGADQGTFTMNAVIDNNGQIINTSKTYALNRIVSNGLGQPMTAEFWILNGPTKFYI